ncbi:MAG: signal recognition particle-docking protein FtsY, partial [Nanoarchaeota archaeon]
IEQTPAPEEKETKVDINEQKEPKVKPKDGKKNKEKKTAIKEKIVESVKPEEKTEPVAVAEEKSEIVEEKKGFFSQFFKKKEEVHEGEKIQEKTEESVPEKKGIFSRITEKIVTTHISSQEFDSLFEELEMALLENNVAVSVIDKIKNDLKKDLVDKPIKRRKVLDTLKTSLHDSIAQVLSVGKIDLLQRIKETKERPFVIAFIGVNGSGKTTSIAKIAHLLKQNKLSCLMAAGDTWRAASIQQLEEHGKNLGIKVIKQGYGSDPAAVAFDGIKSAQANKIDVVLIDTAGRQQSNKNLMEEMKKIIRVAKPHLKIFIAESIVGNDAVTQGKEFNDAVGIDGIILTKSDIDEKGGAALSITS